MAFSADTFQFCKAKGPGNATVINNATSILQFFEPSESTAWVCCIPEKSEVDSVSLGLDSGSEVIGNGARGGSRRRQEWEVSMPRRLRLTGVCTVKYFTTKQNYSKDWWTRSRDPLTFMKVISYRRPAHSQELSHHLLWGNFLRYIKLSRKQTRGLWQTITLMPRNHSVILGGLLVTRARCWVVLSTGFLSPACSHQPSFSSVSQPKMWPQNLPVVRGGGVVEVWKDKPLWDEKNSQLGREERPRGNL